MAATKTKGKPKSATGRSKKRVSVRSTPKGGAGAKKKTTRKKRPQARITKKAQVYKTKAHGLKRRYDLDAVIMEDVLAHIRMGGQRRDVLGKFGISKHAFELWMKWGETEDTLRSGLHQAGKDISKMDDNIYLDFYIAVLAAEAEPALRATEGWNRVMMGDDTHQSMRDYLQSIRPDEWDRKRERPADTSISVISIGSTDKLDTKTWLKKYGAGDGEQ